MKIDECTLEQKLDKFWNHVLGDRENVCIDTPKRTENAAIISDTVALQINNIVPKYSIKMHGAAKLFLTLTFGCFTKYAKEKSRSTMTKREKALTEAKANVFKALGHPTRLWMAEQLAAGEKCVCELAEGIDADFSTISKHLTVLKQAGVVVDEKRGKQVYYSLRVPCILNMTPCVEAVIQAMLELQMQLVK